MRPFGMHSGFTVPPWPRFQRPPLSSRTAGFPRSGWGRRRFTEGLPICANGSGIGVHTPSRILVCSSLRLVGVVAGVPGSKSWTATSLPDHLRPEPLRSEGVTPHHRSYGLMRRSWRLSLPFRFHLIGSALAACTIHGWSPGPSRIWAVPLLLKCCAPCPGGSSDALDQFFSDDIGLHLPLQGSAPRETPAKRLHAGAYFEAAGIPSCCGPPACSPS